MLVKNRISSGAIHLIDSVSWWRLLRHVGKEQDLERGHPSYRFAP